VIALAASVVLALYVVIPGLLSRFLYQLFIPLRVIAAGKTDGATRALATAVVPFVLALFVVWYVPGLNSIPVHAHAEFKTHDYKLVASCLYSEALFTQNTDAFWQALNRTIQRQSLFLSWYYLLTAMTAVALGYLTASYGKLGSNKYYRWFADKFLFPRISEWHPLFTAFVFADKRTVVRADILMTTDNLYRGRISEHFIDGGGKLTGLILTEAKRFDRRTYLDDSQSENAEQVNAALNTENYWREIPGAKMYLFADQIVNLNLHYDSPEPAEDALLKFLRERLNRSVRIEFTLGPKE
jgi:hypothetical protein